MTKKLAGFTSEISYQNSFKVITVINFTFEYIKKTHN